LTRCTIALTRLGEPPRPAGAGVDDRQDPGGRRERVVPDELGRRDLAAEPLVDGRRLGAVPGAEGRARAGPRPLGFHLGIRGRARGFRDTPPGVLEDLLGQIHRKAVGVVEGEQEAAVHDAPRVAHVLGEIVFDLERAGVERLGEALFLAANRLLDPRPLGDDLRIRPAHQLHDPVDGLPQEGIGEPEHPAVAHGAPHDPAQHVAAPLVGGGHAVGDQERGRARVVGDDPHRHVVDLAGAVPPPGERRDLGDQRGHEVGVPARQLALHNRRDALEPHAGVDRGSRQRRERARCVAVELHEDEVPHLEPAVALARGSQTWPARGHLGARDVVALVEVHLGGGPARAGVTHRPEVVLLAQPQNAIVAESGHALPEREGVVIVRVDGRDQPLAIEGEILREELPGEGDRVGLEVVAEGEVAEHLEERVVARRVADVLEVVVLAARANAFLAGRGTDVGPPFFAEEDGLELDHARVREEQGRIVAGHERRGAHAGVTVALEVL